MASFSLGKGARLHTIQTVFERNVSAIFANGTFAAIRLRLLTSHPSKSMTPINHPLRLGATVVLAIGIPCVALAPAQDGATPGQNPVQSREVVPESNSEPTLAESRLTMGKWIETQQLIGRERNEWSQGKEILKGRVELIGKEVASLQEKIGQSESSVAESGKTFAGLVEQREELKAASAQLVASVTLMEAEVKKIAPMIPDPVRAKLAPLFARLPEDPSTTKVSIAERFQNVLGILNEVNKANSEITVNYEVRTLADGTSSEVQAIYVGLAQAYYISPRGEAGIGRPSADGWKWESAKASADKILTVLEIIQGKQTPAFVPLPVKIK